MKDINEYIIEQDADYIIDSFVNEGILGKAAQIARKAGNTVKNKVSDASSDIVDKIKKAAEEQDKTDQQKLVSEFINNAFKVNKQLNAALIKQSKAQANEVIDVVSQGVFGATPGEIDVESETAKNFFAKYKEDPKAITDTVASLVTGVLCSVQLSKCEEIFNKNEESDWTEYLNNIVTKIIKK